MVTATRARHNSSWHSAKRCGVRTQLHILKRSQTDLSPVREFNFIACALITWHKVTNSHPNKGLNLDPSQPDQHALQFTVHTPQPRSLGHWGNPIMKIHNQHTSWLSHVICESLGVNSGTVASTFLWRHIEKTWLYSNASATLNVGNLTL